jgi:hypothetical protein
MTLDEIEVFCETHAETSAIVVPTTAKRKSGKKVELIRLGRWNEIERV